ncbi:MAG: hypothetical protein ACOCWV_00980 [Planctomycetota bacterium]
MSLSQRIVRRIALTLTTLLVVTASQAANPEVRKAGDILSLKDSVQEISPKNFQLNLTLKGAVPKSSGGGADLTATITRANGKWTAGSASALDYNKAKHVVDAGGLTVTEKRIAGTIKVTIRPDQWVPADKKPRTLTVELDAKVSPLKANTGDEEKPIRFWLIKPRSQGALWKLDGSFTAKMDGRKSDGQAGGTFQLPVRKGHWNMGTWENGVKLSFEMGKDRENWNHVRLAICELGKEVDLSSHEGVRVKVTTDKPRKDVNVTLWMREQDGSWYYVRSAVPLNAKDNEVVVRFEDFVEAEWVSPGNHMDEDYVFDRSAVSHVAVGVVNPLGVGEVNFTLTKLQWVDLPARRTKPAEVAATGKLMAVNGHKVIPAPIFGGYAPDLPQKYRPGTQRYLYAPSYPRIPGHRQAQLGRGDFTDLTGLAKVIVRRDTPVTKRVAMLLGSKNVSKLHHWSENKPRKTPKDAVRMFNDLLKSPSLCDWPTWKDVKLPDALAARVKQLTGRKDPPRMAVMQTNRRLMDTVFGAYLKPMPANPPTEQYYIECYGERFQAAQLLGDGNWKKNLNSWGKRYAANAKENRFPAVLEFWNEPYLNWAERSRVNYKLNYYDVSKAEVGGPVVTKHGLKIPHLTWRRKDGKWQVYDPTAFSYWSGRGNGWMYDQMLSAIAQGVKETYPEVRVIGGWGFRYNEDHWAAWDMLYKPTIDRNIKWIDGIHEHHYQGDTTSMNATYEVLTAYGVTKHDKWLHSYNTETNDLVDAPARGPIDTPEKARRSREYRRMTYNLRDCLYCCYVTPDKAASRTVIHNNHTPTATEIAYGQMKNLRGRLVETTSSERNVWIVSSIDGTDPNAMPREPGQTMVVFVFNNHRTPRTINVRLDAPDNTEFASATQTDMLVDKKTWKLRTADSKHKTDGKTLATTITLPERSACKFSLPLKGKVAAKTQVTRKQFFSADILKEVKPGKSLSTRIELDRAMLAKARRAWLRVVLEKVATGEGSVTIGETTLELPKAYTGDNQAHIVEIPVRLKDLSADTALRFTVNEGPYAGYRVDMASIYLETAK